MKYTLQKGQIVSRKGLALRVIDEIEFEARAAGDGQCILFPRIGLDVFGEDFADLVAEVELQIIFLWREYVTDDRDGLTRQAHTMADALEDCLEEVV